MFATILLPNFYLQAIARHQPKLREQPLAVLDATATKAAILQLNEAAENEGVRAGMTPSQALSRCLHLVIKARARDNSVTFYYITPSCSRLSWKRLLPASVPSNSCNEFVSVKNCKT